MQRAPYNPSLKPSPNGPDLPGCVATGATVEEVGREIREAIAFHIDVLREDGLAVPDATSQVEYIELAA